MEPNIPDFAQYLPSDDSDADDAPRPAASLGAERGAAAAPPDPDADLAQEPVDAEFARAQLLALDQRTAAAGRGGFVLFVDGRHVVYEGPLVKKGTKKAVKRDNPRHCVVFNDVMVLLKPDNKGRLTFKNAIDLSRCTLRNIHVGAHAGPASAMAAAAMGIARFSFEIQAPDRAYVLMAASAASKARWMSELSRVIWRLAPVDLRGVTGWRHQLVVGTQWSAAIRASEEELEDMLIGSRRGCRDAGRDDSDDDSDDALFVDDADSYGWTALHYAAYIGHAGMVGLLLSHGADANVSAPDDTTPLHVAVSRRHADAVAALVSNGASLVARNAAGASAMLMCVQSADSGFASTCMQTLLVHGGSATWTDADGVSLLHHAVLHGQAALIALLSRAGGRTNVLATVEELRVTPLLLACSRPSVDVAVIAALLKHGAHPNLRRPSDGCSPLHILLQRVDRSGPGGDGVAEVLAAANVVLRHGGRLDVCDNAGVAVEVTVKPHMLRPLQDAAAAYRSKASPPSFLPPMGGAVSSTFRSARRRNLGYAVAKDDWADDSSSSACPLCGVKFGMISNRRHHCRHCSMLACSNCSTKTFPLLVTRAPPTSVVDRVCDGCFNSLTEYVDACSRPARAASTGSGDVTSSGPRSAGGDGVTAGAGGAGGGSAAARRESSTTTHGRAAGQLAGLQNTMDETRQALGERGQKIQELGDKTAELAEASARFESMAAQLAKRYR